jgi:hypothetical protein
MPDEPFSNREIRTYFENFEKTLARVEKSVDERVKPLEDELAKMLLWRENILGKITIIVLVLGSLWTLAVATITKKVL